MAKASAPESTGFNPVKLIDHRGMHSKAKAMNGKTLLLSEIFPPKIGGSGRWFWEIYRRLSRETYIIAAGQDVQQDEFDQTHDLRLTRVPLTLGAWGICSWRGFRGYGKAYRAVRRIVKRENIDRLHCGRVLPEGWIARRLNRRYGLPYVCYVHGEEMSYGKASREMRWMMRRVLARCEFVIANSQNTAAILLDGWVPKEKIKILHPGADTERFVPALRDAGVRSKLGWDNRTVLLTVGRLQKRKGQDQLIRALPPIRRTVPDVLYAIIGDGDQRRTLEGLVQQLNLQDCVQFRGETPDEELIQSYQQCDLFVLPNREIDGDIEGFSMVLVEAQACGKPVVAGASGGTAETMRLEDQTGESGERRAESGKLEAVVRSQESEASRIGDDSPLTDVPTGRLVDCTNPEPLAQTVVDLLNDSSLCERMGKAAQQWADKHFSWASLSQQAEALFDSDDSKTTSALTMAVRRLGDRQRT